VTADKTSHQSGTDATSSGVQSPDRISRAHSVAGRQPSYAQPTVASLLRMSRSNDLLDGAVAVPLCPRCRPRESLSVCLAVCLSVAVMVCLLSFSWNSNGINTSNVRPWDNHGKCYTNGKRIQCLSNASRHVPIYLQPFTCYSKILVRNCNFFMCPLHLTPLLNARG